MLKVPLRWARLLPGLLLTLGTGGAACAADGDLDPSFWGDGKVTVGGVDEYWAADDLEVAPNGRLVHAGLVGGTTSFFWQELNDGPLGPVACVFQPPGGASGVYDAEIDFDAQGRLVLAGAVSYAGLGILPVIARFLYPDCTLDTSFDGDGYATYDLFTGDDFTLIRAFTIDSDGKYVLGGEHGSDLQPPGDWFLMRVLGTTGALDSSFSTNGWLVDDFGGTAPSSEVWDLLTLVNLLGPDPIVAVGTAQQGNGYRAALVKLTGSGGFDPIFGGGDGIILTLFDAAGAKGRAVARDPVGGRLYVAGVSAGPGQTLGGGIRSFTSTGEYDAGFGLVLLSDADPFVHPERLLVDSLGRLVTAGYAAYIESGQEDFYVARHWPSGLPDTTFGDNGVVIVPFDLGTTGFEHDQATAVVLQSGRIALAGWVEVDDSSAKAAVVRLDVALIFADGYERGNTGAWSSTAL